MRSISDICPFETSFDIVHFPDARIIGLKTRSGGSLGNTAPALWDKVFSSGAIEELLKLPSIADKATFGWTCDYDPQTDTFAYWVCVLTPAQTPVPAGFDHLDLIQTDCAYGLFGEDTMTTASRAREAGYETNWKLCPWNAEMYLAAEEDNPPKICGTPWHWLVPVIKT